MERSLSCIFRHTPYDHSSKTLRPCGILCRLVAPASQRVGFLQISLGECRDVIIDREHNIQMQNIQTTWGKTSFSCVSPGPHKGLTRVARSFDRAGIAWLLVEGSKLSFISWSKLKITLLGKRYVWIMCSGITNKLMCVKILSLLPRALCSLRCLLHCSHFKCKIV